MHLRDGSVPREKIASGPGVHGEREFPLVAVEPPMELPPQTRLLRLPEVAAAVGLRKTSIYNNIRTGTFPQPVRLTPRARAWRSDEIAAWIAERTAARDARAGAP